MLSFASAEPLRSARTDIRGKSSSAMWKVNVKLVELSLIVFVLGSAVNPAVPSGPASRTHTPSTKIRQFSVGSS